MLQQKLFLLFGGKKKFIWLAGIGLIVLTFSSKFISIKHWEEIGWELTSYHPSVPVIGILWASFYMLILYLRKVWAPSLWFIGVIGMMYSLLMFWAMWLRV